MEALHPVFIGHDCRGGCAKPGESAALSAAGKVWIPYGNPRHPSLSDICDGALLQPSGFYKAPGADDFLRAQLPPEFLKRRPKVLSRDRELLSPLTKASVVSLNYMQCSCIGSMREGAPSP